MAAEKTNSLLLWYILVTIIICFASFYFIPNRYWIPATIAISIGNIVGYLEGRFDSGTYE